MKAKSLIHKMWVYFSILASGIGKPTKGKMAESPSSNREKVKFTKRKPRATKRLNAHHMLELIGVLP